MAFTTATPIDTQQPALADQSVSTSPSDDENLVQPKPVPRWAVRYRQLLVVADTLVIIWAGVGAHLLHYGTLTSRLSRDPGFSGYLLLTELIAFGWLLALAIGETRAVEVVGTGPDEYKRLVRSTIVVFGAAAVSSYVFDLQLPRSYVLIMMPAGLIGLVVERFLARRWLHAKRLNGQYLSNVVVVGDAATARELINDLGRQPLAGYRVIGVCTSRGDERLRLSDISGVPIIGGYGSIAEVAASVGADAVAVTASNEFGPTRVRSLSWDLDKHRLDLILAPALTNIAGPRVHTKPIAGLPLIHVDRPTYDGANKLLKRLFDIALSIILLTLFLPALAIVALMIWLPDRGSVFFRQERVGLNGAPFAMVKFRSMCVDAESRLAEVMAQQTDVGNSVLFKMKDDPRVTKVGKFIRRYSIDEVPQLVNVLAGNMSLVGPRPPLASEVEQYGEDARLRLLVKPGMTGLWQVSGRSNLSWDDTIRLDCYYVENWSVTADLLILWRTAKAVCGSSGAY